MRRVVTLSLRPSSDSPIAALDDQRVPGLNASTQLLKHQKYGVNWMINRETLSDYGILADSMGLGKTLQIICLLLRSQSIDSRASAKTLLVVPSALIHQWLGEFQAHVRDDYPLVVSVFSSSSDHDFLLARERSDVVLTTFSTISSLFARSNASAALFSHLWNRVILDEAQCIHNPGTLVFKAIVSLRSIKRWAVTGTPIQNNLRDLYSLFAFLRVTPYSDWKHFKRLVLDKLARGEVAVVNKRIAAILGVICLRRESDCLDGLMPDREFHMEMVDLDHEEQVLYDRVLQTARDGVGSVSSSHLLTVVLRLRQVVLHPGLLHQGVDSQSTPTPEHSPGRQETKRLSRIKKYKRCRGITCKDGSWYFDCICGIFGYNIDDGELMISCDQCQVWMHAICFSHVDLSSEHCCVACRNDQCVQSHESERRTLSSSKIQRAVEICENACAVGDKVVIFSQFTSLLTLARKQFEKFGLAVYNGSLSEDQRQLQLLRFKHDPKTSILLASLKCGAVGLNLTSANHIILLDSWWNPAVEKQAMDRVFRIGQQKCVHVWKLIVRNSIEQRILELQDTKNKLATFINSYDENVTRGHKISSIDIEDLRVLIS